MNIRLGLSRGFAWPYSYLHRCTIFPFCLASRFLPRQAEFGRRIWSVAISLYLRFEFLPFVYVGGSRLNSRLKL